MMLDQVTDSSQAERQAEPEVPTPGFFARFTPRKSPITSLMIGLSLSNVELPMVHHDFYTKLKDSSLPALSSILKVIRMKELGGVRHEYLLVNATIGERQNTIWLRLERAAKRQRGRFSPWSALSEFPSNDTVRIAASDELLMGPEPCEVKTIVCFKSPEEVTLAVLLSLLSSFADGSPRYKLLSDNCWFFCYTVLQLLSESFEHTIDGRIGHENLSKVAYKEIKEYFRKWLSDPKSLAQCTYPPCCLRGIAASDIQL
jgi:hypothetical protein